MNVLGLVIAAIFAVFILASFIFPEFIHRRFPFLEKRNNALGMSAGIVGALMIFWSAFETHWQQADQKVVETLRYAKEQETREVVKAFQDSEIVFHAAHRYREMPNAIFQHPNGSVMGNFEAVIGKYLSLHGTTLRRYRTSLMQCADSGVCDLETLKSLVCKDFRLYGFAVETWRHSNFLICAQENYDSLNLVPFGEGRSFMFELCEFDFSATKNFSTEFRNQVKGQECPFD